MKVNEKISRRKLTAAEFWRLIWRPTVWQSVWYGQIMLLFLVSVSSTIERERGRDGGGQRERERSFQFWTPFNAEWKLEFHQHWYSWSTLCAKQWGPSLLCCFVRICPVTYYGESANTGLLDDFIYFHCIPSFWDAVTLRQHLETFAVFSVAFHLCFPNSCPVS